MLKQNDLKNYIELLKQATFIYKGVVYDENTKELFYMPELQYKLNEECDEADDYFDYISLFYECMDDYLKENDEADDYFYRVYFDYVISELDYFMEA